MWQALLKNLDLCSFFRIISLKWKMKNENENRFLDTHWSQQKLKRAHALQDSSKFRVASDKNGNVIVIILFCSVIHYFCNKLAPQSKENKMKNLAIQNVDELRAQFCVVFCMGTFHRGSFPSFISFLLGKEFCLGNCNIRQEVLWNGVSHTLVIRCKSVWQTW